MRNEFGYAGVTSREQNLGHQLDAFEEFGLDRGHVYADKASGTDFKQPRYQKKT